MQFAVPDISSYTAYSYRSQRTRCLPVRRELGPFLDFEDGPTLRSRCNLDLGAFYERWLRHDDLTLRVHFWQALKGNRKA